MRTVPDVDPGSIAIDFCLAYTLAGLREELCGSTIIVLTSADVDADTRKSANRRYESIEGCYNAAKVGQAMPDCALGFGWHQPD